MTWLRNSHTLNEIPLCVTLGTLIILHVYFIIRGNTKFSRHFLSHFLPRDWNMWKKILQLNAFPFPSNKKHHTFNKIYINLSLMLNILSLGGRNVQLYKRSCIFILLFWRSVSQSVRQLVRVSLNTAVTQKICQPLCYLLLHFFNSPQFNYHNIEHKPPSQKWKAEVLKNTKRVICLRSSLADHIGTPMTTSDIKRWIRIMWERWLNTNTFFSSNWNHFSL
jgi:hypothetical protein